MLTVGDRLPHFRLQACVSRDAGAEFAEIAQDAYPGKWLVLFAWPLDFTFVCPTEIAEFGKRAATSASATRRCSACRATRVRAPRLAQQHPDLKNLPFPMLADVKRELSQALGILHKQEGIPLRATFIVDPEGVIRTCRCTTSTSAATVDEVLRTLDALQTDELCPCNWKPGQPTLAG
jgi:alkyl hydroperoxide reductase subunit AhpC